VNAKDNSKTVAIAIVQRLIINFENEPDYDSDDEIAQELRRIYKQLERRKQALLQPKPKQSRKQKTQAQQEYEHLTRTQTASGDGVTVIPVPQGLQVSKDAIGKRVRK